MADNQPSSKSDVTSGNNDVLLSGFIYFKTLRSQMPHFYVNNAVNCSKWPISCDLGQKRPFFKFSRTDFLLNIFLAHKKAQ